MATFMMLFLLLMYPRKSHQRIAEQACQYEFREQNENRKQEIQFICDLKEKISVCELEVINNGQWTISKDYSCTFTRTDDYKSSTCRLRRTEVKVNRQLSNSQCNFTVVASRGDFGTSKYCKKREIVYSFILKM